MPVSEVTPREVGFGYRGYPTGLVDLGRKAPEVMHVVGEVPPMERCVAVIGARRSTPYGEALARLVGRECARRDLVVVTGAAMGCEAAAARAALEAGGRVAVVTLGGADVAYPPSSRDIYEAAWGGRGCALSAMPDGQGPRRISVEVRHAITVAMASSVYVCEASKSSGVMGMAALAHELGRATYAFPGSVFSPTSEGANELIADGRASAVCGPQGLAAALDHDHGEPAHEMALGELPRMDRITAALTACPMTAQEATTMLGMDEVEALRVLATLESRGDVTRCADGRYMPASSFLEAAWEGGDDERPDTRDDEAVR